MKKWFQIKDYLRYMNAGCRGIENDLKYKKKGEICLIFLLAMCYTMISKIRISTLINGVLMSHGALVTYNSVRSSRL